MYYLIFSVRVFYSIQDRRHHTLFFAHRVEAALTAVAWQVSLIAA